MLLVVISLLVKYDVQLGISTVDHDNTQLRWGRPGIPLCDFGKECDAHSLVGNNGPLPIYLTPSQQAKFDEDGTLPEGPGFCLLCIRRDCHAMHLGYSAFLSSNDVQLGRKIFVYPPFQNLVDTVGGYKRWAVLPKASFFPMDISLVGVSGTLSVKYNPIEKQFYVDQGDIVYGADFPPRRVE